VPTKEENEELDRQHEAANPEFDREALKKDIKTWEEEDAPPAERWHACVGDYDLDATVGTGECAEDAISDLLDQLEDEWDNNPDNSMARLRVLMEKDD
jgi:hypothetical protein